MLPTSRLASPSYLFAAALLLALVMLQGCGKSCVVNGKTYEDGDEWKCDCNTCMCNDGEYGATRLACIDAGDLDASSSQN